MEQRKSRRMLHQGMASLTAAVLAAASLPVCAVSSEAYNTWTGYVLQDSTGRYLSVLGGTEGEVVQVGFYEADGAAPYNTWYFTKTDLGITIKSALSQGEYYLTENTRENRLELSTSAGQFELGEDGCLRGFRSGVESPVYAQVTPEPVTNLRMGDWNHDGTVNGMDLTLLRQAVQRGTADFAQQAVGDTNGDGVLDGADVQLLQQYLLGESVSLAEVSMPSCTIVPPAVQQPDPGTTEPAHTTATTETTVTMTTETTQTTADTAITEVSVTTTTEAPRQDLTMADFPAEYLTASDWIWNNRISTEGSAKDWATIYDQIVAGNGTLHYILMWQSYEKITLEQRQKLPQMLENAINQWTDHLKGWDGWKFDHVNVKIVGYAVLDKDCLLDLQPDEVVYTDTASSWLRDDMISSGMGDSSVPAIQPAEPTDISRYSHWADKNWTYNGSYENRYDMYLHGITGMINMGGYGYHYGQILSDQSVLGLIDGTTSQHVLLHEMGHGFGLPDYYGGEGESDGFPPGGFPGGENSIMMAGSAQKITDFDGWFFRYLWSKLKEENGRFQ